MAFFFRLFLCTDPGGDDGDPHFIFHTVIHGGTPENFSIFADLVVDEFGSLGNLLKFHFAGAGDIHQDTLGTGDGYIFQKRMRDGLFSSLDGPVFPGRDSNTHDGHPGFGHGCADIGEIQIDNPRHHNQIGNTLNGMQQDFIGSHKHFHQGCLFRRQAS